MKRTLRQTTKLLLVTVLVSVSSALFISGTAHRAQAREVDREASTHRHTIRREGERPSVPREAARPPAPREAAHPPVPREEVRREEIRREETQRLPRPADRRIRE